MSDAPSRGDLIYLDFNPQAGHEQAGRRPALVLSPKPFNEKTGFAFVCPITSHKKGYPFEVELPEDGNMKGVILTEQLKSLDWTARSIQIKGKANEDTLANCLNLIHLILFTDID